MTTTDISAGKHFIIELGSAWAYLVRDSIEDSPYITIIHSMHTDGLIRIEIFFEEELGEELGQKLLYKLYDNLSAGTTEILAALHLAFGNTGLSKQLIGRGENVIQEGVDPEESIDAFIRVNSLLTNQSDPNLLELSEGFAELSQTVRECADLERSESKVIMKELLRGIVFTIDQTINRIEQEEGDDAA